MVGILFYVASMWVAGIGQGLSLNELTADGSAPANTFIETLKNILPMYYLRALGGGLYLCGFLLMVYNLWRTIRSGTPTDGGVAVPAETAAVPPAKPFAGFANAPVLFTLAIIGTACLAARPGRMGDRRPRRAHHGRAGDRRPLRDQPVYLEELA
jgi:cytochrome c oxidase cbb3-type subunit I/II